MTRSEIDVRRLGRTALAVWLLSLAATACTDAPATELRTSDLPWFGLTPPPGLVPHQLQVISERAAAPAAVPTGEGGFTELAGASLHRDLETIVAFSKESEETSEVGNGQLWGRITGLPSGRKTIEWAADQLRAAGIDHVELQQFDQDDGASLWLPLSWEVRVLGNPKFGSGSADVVLESAMPLSAGDLPPEGVSAPLVYVGMASPAELAHVDVRGKVAVQRAIPQGHTVFIRSPVGPRAADLLDRGAVAVLTIVDLPGNMRVKDMGCGGGACFNIGGEDGLFLESVFDSVAAAGGNDEVRVHLQLDSERRSGLSGENAVAIIPGTSRPDEYVVIDAHSDAWFDGAGDNGDGLAVMLGVARHFARPGMRQERSLVFIASAGHHSAGLSGPSHFIAMNQGIIDHTVLIVNLEHTSERNIVPARSEADDGYREWTMDAYEAPVVAGVTNLAPYVEGLVAQGIQRYGTNFVSGPNTMASGEGGSFSRTGVPVFTTMQGSPLYHTTGEVIDMISTPGMERMARFMAFFVSKVSGAQAAELDPE